MSMNQSKDPLRVDVAPSIRKHWLLFVVEGIVLIVLGFLAVLLPPLATLGVTLFLGWLFVISGIFHVLKTGCRWRDCPQAYGPPTTIYNRYNRWSGRGIWRRLFEKIAASAAVPEELSLDSSHVKAHRSAAGGKGGKRARRSAARAAAGPARSMLWPIIAADRSPSR